MKDGCSENNLVEGKETLRKSALHNYGLYILSSASGNPNCFLKYDAAQKAAFRLGLLAHDGEKSPFSKLLELDEFYKLGKIAASALSHTTPQKAF